MVPSTFSFLIANPTTGSSSSRKPAYIPASALSIVISYIGDNPNATPAPGATAPASLPSANSTTLNVTTTSTNPPPAGQCVQVGSGLLCTAAITLPVGIIDLYIQAYSATNGGGTLYANSVTRVQVNSTGTLTSPGTSTAATPAPLSANITAPSAIVSPPATTLALAAQQAFPAPTATATAIAIPASGALVVATSNGQFSYSGGQQPVFYGPDGSAVPVGNAITSLVVGDADTSGNTCLIYIPYNSTTSAKTAAPCSFASAGATSAPVTLSNSGDQYVVLYDGKAVAGAGFNVTYTVTGTTATSTPKPQLVTITSAVANLASTVASTVAKSGAIVYDPTGKKVYVGTTSAGFPLLTATYSTTSGYGGLAQAAPATVNGVTATTLTSGGAQSLVLGPDNNIWFAENNTSSTSEYVGVLVANASLANPLGGTAISTGTTAYGEYALSATSASTAVAVGNAGGYIWLIDAADQLWRVNPLTGAVNPNKATGYAAGGTKTSALPVTTAAGSTTNTTAASTNFVTIGSNLYFGTSAKTIVKLALDTSTSPSAGVCTTTGPPPCVAAATVSGNTTTGAPVSLSTDGTNVYVVDAGGLLYSVSTSLVVTPAAANTLSTNAGFSRGGGTYYGGLGQGSDGYFWSQTGATFPVTGIASVTSAASTATTAPGATNAACQAASALVGANGFIVGPDSTLLFAPTVASSTTQNLCGVIY